MATAADLHRNVSDLIDRLQKLEETEYYMSKNLDMFFLISMSLIIYFMQCGFAFLESGSVRSKNTTNILIKNFMESFIAAISYWIIGYPLAYGKGNPFCGEVYWAHYNLPPEQWASWFFQFVFAATASTIVSGAMAERCDFVGYISYSILITGFMYPIVSHWAWSDEGWLSRGFDKCLVYNGSTCVSSYTVKFQDFAGSGVVHLVGGTAAFVGAAFLGARRGRFDKEGEPIPIKGHSVPLAALGGFILFFGFFAFNGGSQASISQEGDGIAVARACINTIIAGTCGAFLCLIYKRIHGHFNQGNKHWSLLTTLNGGLAGMVSICASADVVYTWSAAVIGFVAGISYLWWSYLVLKIKIDDPLDAAAVHLGGGLWGVIARPIFTPATGILFNWNIVSALHFGWNLAGAAVIIAWSALLAGILFFSMKKLGILRVSKEIEEKGLDIPKHGEPAYPVLSYGHGWEEDKDLLHSVMKSSRDNLSTSSSCGQVVLMVDPKSHNVIRQRFENAENHATLNQHLSNGTINVAYTTDDEQVNSADATTLNSSSLPHNGIPNGTLQVPDTNTKPNFYLENTGNTAA